MTITTRIATMGSMLGLATVLTVGAASAQNVYEFETVDVNGDGILSEEEMRAVMPDAEVVYFMESVDSDQDGQLSAEEFRQRQAQAGDDENTDMSNSAMGAGEGDMTDNGMSQDGMMNDGMAADGTSDGGMAMDGMSEDGMNADGMSADGMTDGRDMSDGSTPAEDSGDTEGNSAN